MSASATQGGHNYSSQRSYLNYRLLRTSTRHVNKFIDVTFQQFDALLYVVLG